MEAAQAKVAEARANLAGLEAGGKPAEITDIENSLARARFDLQEAKSDYASLRRLAEKQAATEGGSGGRAREGQANRTGHRGPGEAAHFAGGQAGCGGGAGAPPGCRGGAGAGAANAQEQSVLRAPISGVVYDLAARPGAYLETGDLVANVGQLDRLRVRVYVDEPELGRVRPGQPVTIRWQALPGKQWHGTVERKPASIQPLGSRQVGEVVCTIENPGRELIPGTNVDAEIRTAVAADALVIPGRRCATMPPAITCSTVKEACWSAAPSTPASPTSPRCRSRAAWPKATPWPCLPKRRSSPASGLRRRRRPAPRGPDVNWFFHVCFRLPLRRGRGPIRLVSRSHPLSLVRAGRGQHGLDVRHHGPAALQPGPQAGHARAAGRARQRRHRGSSRPATPPPSS